MIMAHCRDEEAEILRGWITELIISRAGARTQFWQSPERLLEPQWFSLRSSHETVLQKGGVCENFLKDDQDFVGYKEANGIKRSTDSKKQLQDIMFSAVT